MRNVLMGALALSLAAGIVRADNIRMATDGAFPPFNLINDGGEIDGFERELGDELCRRADLTCTWIINEWDSIIPNLVSGNFDAIMAGMSITHERDEVIDFTQPYYPPTASAYAALAGSNPDLQGGVIAAQVNTIQASHIVESGAKLVEFATPDETIAAIRNGEADAVFADEDYLVPIIAESDGELEFLGEDILLGEGMGVGLRESDAELKQKLDKVITAMKRDGTLNEMLKKWFGPNTRIWDQ